VTEKVRRHLRPAVAIKVGRGRDHGKASRRAEWHRDHVARHEIRGPEAHVEPFCDDVDDSAFGDQIDMDLRITPQESQDQRLEDLAGAAGERVDAQRAGRHILLRILEAGRSSPLGRHSIR
jgi:hypothetical protein